MGTHGCARRCERRGREKIEDVDLRVQTWFQKEESRGSIFLMLHTLTAVHISVFLSDSIL